MANNTAPEVSQPPSVSDNTSAGAGGLNSLTAADFRLDLGSKDEMSSLRSSQPGADSGRDNDHLVAGKQDVSGQNLSDQERLNRELGNNIYTHMSGNGAASDQTTLESSADGHQLASTSPADSHGDTPQDSGTASQPGDRLNSSKNNERLDTIQPGDQTSPTAGQHQTSGIDYQRAFRPGGSG